jgi:hypothetical protein
MQSTAKKATDDPHDFVVVPSDQVQVAPSDAEAVAPSDAEITGLLRAAARQRSESGGSETTDRSGSAPVPAVDTTFRATAVNNNVSARGPTFGRRLLRAVVALLLAIVIGAAAMTWQTLGYTAKKAMLKWAPKLALSASLPLDKLGLSAESAPAGEPAVADATPAQSAAPAQGTSEATPENRAPETSAPEKAAANPAASSSDTAQLLQSMARDLANLGQEVEILKASTAELKASQQKLSDKASEPNARAKAVSTPPRPSAGVAARRPVAAYSPTPALAAPLPAYRSAPSYSTAAQAAVAPPVPPAAAQPYVTPPAPLQSQVEPGLTSPPRPPLPVQQQ